MREIFRRIFYDILLAMDRDWSDAVGRDRSLLCIMTDNASLSRRCSNMLISINATAATCYAMTGLIRQWGDFMGDLNVSSRELPIKMEFPFNVDTSPFFEFLAVCQCLHEVSIAALVATINSLIVTLVSLSFNGRLCETYVFVLCCLKMASNEMFSDLTLDLDMSSLARNCGYICNVTYIILFRLFKLFRSE